MQLTGALEQANYTTSQANSILRDVERYCEIQGAGALRNFILSQEKFERFKLIADVNTTKQAKVPRQKPKRVTLLPDGDADFVFPEHDTPEEELEAILTKLDPNTSKFDLIMAEGSIKRFQRYPGSERKFNLVKAIAHNPGIAVLHLERELGISMPSIRAHLKELEAKDLIVWHRANSSSEYKGRVFLKNRKL